MYGISAGPIHQLPVTFMVAAPEKADTGQLIFRTLHQVVTPQTGQGRIILTRGIDRVHMVILFPTGEGLALVFASDLPAAGIAAEKCDVAARGDKLFKVVAHR